MKIILPEKVSYIINELEKAGYEAYAVGGCVRDSLLNREPQDWDITTSANPYEVKKVFPRTIDTGIQHGTVTVMLEKEGFEITTYRIDGEYEDSRHPKEVIFTSNLLEDLKRRDFTINAMAYNEKVGLVDAFHGIDDLTHKIIRCVGVAKERFEEDALRMMRAVRFSAQLGYEIEEETQNAIRLLAPTLKNISAERIQTEWIKLLISPNPDYMKKVYELGLTSIFLPEFDEAIMTEQNNPHHMYSVGEHLLHCTKYVENKKDLRIAALLHDIGKPSTKKTDEQDIDHFYNHATVSEEMSQKILRRLKFDNDTITSVKKYVKYHDISIEETSKSVRKAISKIGPEYFLGVLKLKKADILSQSEYNREDKIKHLDTIMQLYSEILEKKECICLKDLAVSGNDLISLGVPQGKEIGKILNALFQEVLESPEKNQRDYLLERVKTQYNK